MIQRVGGSLDPSSKSGCRSGPRRKNDGKSENYRGSEGTNVKRKKLLGGLKKGKKRETQKYLKNGGQEPEILPRQRSEAVGRCKR